MINLIIITILKLNFETSIQILKWLRKHYWKNFGWDLSFFLHDITKTGAGTRILAASTNEFYYSWESIEMGFVDEVLKQKNWLWKYTNFIIVILYLFFYSHERTLNEYAHKYQSKVLESVYLIL